MIAELLESVKKVNEGLQSGDTIRDVLMQHDNDILDLQKIQLFNGMASDGNELHPFYSEDLQPGGFFKSADSAKRYADWKQTINYPIQANRNPDAPNLYINGRFHDELNVDFGADAVAVIGGTMYAKNIVNKYGINNFGLTTENWNKIFNEHGALAELIESIKKQLSNTD